MNFLDPILISQDSGKFLNQICKKFNDINLKKEVQIDFKVARQRGMGCQG